MYEKIIEQKKQNNSYENKNTRRNNEIKTLRQNAVKTELQIVQRRLKLSDINNVNLPTSARTGRVNVPRGLLIENIVARAERLLELRCSRAAGRTTMGRVITRHMSGAITTRCVASA